MLKCYGFWLYLLYSWQAGYSLHLAISLFIFNFRGDSMIINPILRGLNPDPSVIRIDNDYYIATSTFEWWPGVQIHHSKNLAN